MIYESCFCNLCVDWKKKDKIVARGLKKMEEELDLSNMLEKVNQMHCLIGTILNDKNMKFMGKFNKN